MSKMCVCVYTFLIDTLFFDLFFSYTSRQMFWNMLSFFAFHFQYPHIGCGVEEGRECLCQELRSVHSCVLSTALECSALGCGGVTGGYALVKVWRGETREVVEYLAATIVEDEDAEGC